MLIGIDGCGGAGKSTLAVRLAALDPNISVVHVLAPLNQETPARYQRYDWNWDALAEWHDVPAGGTVIVEGIYTTWMMKLDEA